MNHQSGLGADVFTYSPSFTYVPFSYNLNVYVCPTVARVRVTCLVTGCLNILLTRLHLPQPLHFPKSFVFLPSLLHLFSSLLASVISSSLATFLVSLFFLLCRSLSLFQSFPPLFFLILPFLHFLFPFPFPPSFLLYFLNFFLLFLFTL